MHLFTVVVNFWWFGCKLCSLISCSYNANVFRVDGTHVCASYIKFPRHRLRVPVGSTMKLRPIWCQILQRRRHVERNRVDREVRILDDFLPRRSDLRIQHLKSWESMSSN